MALLKVPPAVYAGAGLMLVPMAGLVFGLYSDLIGKEGTSGSAQAISQALTVAEPETVAPEPREKVSTLAKKSASSRWLKKKHHRGSAAAHTDVERVDPAPVVVSVERRTWESSSKRAAANLSRRTEDLQRFQTEETDPAWAKTQQSAIEGVLAQLEASEHIASLECRSTLCRLVWKTSAADSPVERAKRVARLAARMDPQRTVSTEPAADGTDTQVLYLHRTADTDS